MLNLMAAIYLTVEYDRFLNRIGVPMPKHVFINRLARRAA